MWGRTATELAAGIRAREFSVREVMEAHLARIEAVNPRVNAIVTLDAEGALRAADEADAGEPRGVLHGLPIAVKDLEDTAGMRTTYGSPLFADARARRRLAAGGAPARRGRDRDRQDQHARVRRRVADVQRRLRRDAQPVGPVADAGRVERWRGGRGGGGMLPFADGSDLGASVRNPAAFCGLVGLRPSPGVIPDAGPGDPWNPLPVLGPIARTVEDVALLLSALAGPDPRDPLSVGGPFVAELGRRARAADRLEPRRSAGCRSTRR